MVVSSDKDSFLVTREQNHRMTRANEETLIKKQILQSSKQNLETDKIIFYSEEDPTESRTLSEGSSTCDIAEVPQSNSDSSSIAQYSAIAAVIIVFIVIIASKIFPSKTN